MTPEQFTQLKQCLPEYYSGGPDNVVGYLRGSASAEIWRQMEATRRPQMLILGSSEPDYEDWVAAGVSQRFGDTRTITLELCETFIILYAGFIRRPWGSLVTISEAAVGSFPSSLASWTRNRPRRR